MKLPLGIFLNFMNTTVYIFIVTPSSKIFHKVEIVRIFIQKKCIILNHYTVNQYMYSILYCNVQLEKSWELWILLWTLRGHGVKRLRTTGLGILTNPYTLLFHFAHIETHPAHPTDMDDTSNCASYLEELCYYLSDSILTWWTVKQVTKSTEIVIILIKGSGPYLVQNIIKTWLWATQNTLATAYQCSSNNPLHLYTHFDIPFMWFGFICCYFK